jgi:hypothetical protein
MLTCGAIEKNINDEIAALKLSFEGKYVYDVEEKGYRLVIAIGTNTALVSKASGKYKNAYTGIVVFIADVGITDFDWEELEFQRSDIALLCELFDQYHPDDLNRDFMTIPDGDICDPPRPPPPDVPTANVQPAVPVPKRRRTEVSDDDISFAVGARKFLDILLGKAMSAAGNYIYGQVDLDLKHGFGTEESIREVLCTAFRFYTSEILYSCFSIDFGVSTAVSSDCSHDNSKLVSQLADNFISHCKYLL